MFNAKNHWYDDFNAVDALEPAELDAYENEVANLRSRFPWSHGLDKVFDNTLAHLSKHVPGKIEYYSSVANMLAGKKTRTSPEMFLLRYLVDATREIKASWEAEAMGKILPIIQFKENNDPEGWAFVYRHGPSSCMRGRTLAVQQYAHPKNHLALAYATRIDGEPDDIISRAIVNKKHMTWNRIYSNDEDDFGAPFFAAALLKLGYHCDDNQTLHHEIIHLRWETCCVEECGKDVMVGPYLDCDGQEVSPLADGSSSGIIDEGSEYLQYEEGDEGYVCSSCS